MAASQGSPPQPLAPKLFLLLSYTVPFGKFVWGVVHTYVHVQARELLRYSSQVAFILVFHNGSHFLETYQVGSASQHWDCKRVPQYPGIFMCSGNHTQVLMLLRHMLY